MAVALIAVPSITEEGRVMQLTQNSWVFATILLAATLAAPQLSNAAGPSPLSDSNAMNIDGNSTLEFHVDSLATCTPESDEIEFSGRSVGMVQSSIAGGVIVKKQPGECNGMIPAVQNSSKADGIFQGNSTPILASAFLKD